MLINRLLQQQLNTKMSDLEPIKQVTIPSIGWIKSIRSALGMTMQQLGNKLSISKQAVLDIEKREKDGSITIKSLREIARVLDMELVYAFVPREKSLDALIEKRARTLATKIVLRTSQSMKLEAQENSPKRIKKAIEERTKKIKSEMPKFLWD